MKEAQQNPRIPAQLYPNWTGNDNGAALLDYSGISYTTTGGLNVNYLASTGATTSYTGDQLIKQAG